MHVNDVEKAQYHLVRKLVCEHGARHRSKKAAAASSVSLRDRITTLCDCQHSVRIGFRQIRVPLGSGDGSSGLVPEIALDVSCSHCNHGYLADNMDPPDFDGNGDEFWASDTGIPGFQQVMAGLLVPGTDIALQGLGKSDGQMPAALTMAVQLMVRWHYPTVSCALLYVKISFVSS